MNLVKWGGSLITDKAAAKPTPQRERITALAAALAASDASAVLVHGAGSFGHPLAKRFGLAQGSDGSPEQAAAVVRTRQQVRTLNALVCEALAAAGLEPVPILPSQALRTAGSQTIIDFPAASFEAALEAGRLPVTCGDVTDDNSQGVAILSGDTLMVALARALRPQRALFVINHPGVMDRDPAEPGAQLVGVERLCYVVVGAGLQARDDIVAVRPGRDHDYRHVADPADPPADLEPVDARQHDVDQDDVAGIGGEHVECRLAALGLVDLVALLLEDHPHGCSDPLIVLDDQDAGTHTGNRAPNGGSLH